MRSLPLAFALVLLASGCIGGGPAGPTGSGSETSPAEAPERPLSALAKILPFETRARDGVKLAGHVYLPEGTGRFATVLDVSPYFNTGEFRSDRMEKTVNGRRTMDAWYTPLMDDGFAVALVNVRGSGLSEGCFQFGSKMDWPDMATIVEALAGQPWSNGNVGMYGISYDGWTQYMAMTQKPPSLKAVVPSSGVIDYWSLITRNGAPIDTTPLLQAEWTVNSAAGLFIDTGVLLFLLGYSSSPEHAIPTPPHPSHFTCPEHAANTPPNLQLAWNGDRLPYFEDRDYRPYIANSSIPILVTNGLTNGEGHILQFEGLWDLMAGTTERRMLLGQHGHDFPNREEWPTLLTNWFDHYLRGGPKLVETGIVEYQDDRRGWHTSDRWPPASREAVLFLSDRTVVNDPNEVKSGQQVFQSTSRTSPGNLCGPLQATYVSPPLAEDLLLAGNFVVNVTVTSNLPDGNFAVYVYSTPGDGSCTDRSMRPIRHAMTDLRHWESKGMGRDFPTNTPTLLELRSIPFAAKVPAGSRLVVAIGGGSSELTPEPRLPALTISTGPERGGVVRLPVVEGELRFE